MADLRSGPTRTEIAKVEDEKGNQITQLKADLAEAQQKHISGYWVCSKCGNIEFSEREVKCWKCGEGEMIYQDKHVLRDFIQQSTEAFRNLKQLKADLAKCKPGCNKPFKVSHHSPLPFSIALSMAPRSVWASQIGSGTPPQTHHLVFSVGLKPNLTFSIKSNLSLSACNLGRAALSWVICSNRVAISL